MVVRVLCTYWGDRLKYCENHRQKLRPHHNLAKNHDFGLKLCYNNFRLIVLWRNPEASIRSWWKLNTGRERTEPKEEWEAFWREKAKFWQDWMVRWVFPSHRRPHVILTYEGILKNPVEEIAKIIQLQSDEPVDKERLKRAVQNENISPR